MGNNLKELNSRNSKTHYLCLTCGMHWKNADNPNASNISPNNVDPFLHELSDSFL